MNDTPEPDDDSTFVADEATREIEVDLLLAIAADYEAMTGIDVMVTSYMVVAEVINDDGQVEMMWTTTDNMPAQAMLGHAHWLLKRVDEAT